METTRRTAESSQTESNAPSPSPLFLQVVQEIGEKIGLDAPTIVAGAPIEYKGVTFCIVHHGDRDPEGLVLMIHMGTVAAEFESTILRQLLEHNAMTPAGASGYYSLLPGTDTAAFCIRLNMARAHNACDAVLAYMSLFARQLEDLTRVMDDGLAAALQQTGAAPGLTPAGGPASGGMS